MHRAEQVTGNQFLLKKQKPIAHSFSSSCCPTLQTYSEIYPAKHLKPKRSMKKVQDHTFSGHSLKPENIYIAVELASANDPHKFNPIKRESINIIKKQIPSQRQPYPYQLLAKSAQLGFQHEASGTINYFVQKCVIEPKINMFINQLPLLSDESRLHKKKPTVHFKFNQDTTNPSDSFASTRLIEKSAKTKKTEASQEKIQFQNLSSCQALPHPFSSYSFGKQKAGLLAKLLVGMKSMEVEQKRQSFTEEETSQAGKQVVQSLEVQHQHQHDIKSNQQEHDSGQEKETLFNQQEGLRRTKTTQNPIKDGAMGGLFKLSTLKHSLTINDAGQSDKDSEVIEDFEYKSMLRKIHQNNYQNLDQYFQ